MLMNIIGHPTIDLPARRSFLARTGAVTLSAAAIGLLANTRALASKKHQGMSTGGDVSILNVALGLEHEAIGAYQIGAESGLLQQPVLKTAVLFQSHHKQHADTLIATIRKLGGSPVEAKQLSDYATALKADMLKNQTDVLQLAARLEKGAANAYVGVLPSFQDPVLGQVAARLATDESMHWIVLANALGEPVPQMALFIGS